MVTEKKFKTVSIIGGGLIGSSLAHSIRENHLCDNLRIFDSKTDVRKKLKEIFSSHEICENLNETVIEADLVFLCVPVGSMRDLAKKTYEKTGLKTMAVGNIYEPDHVNSILMAGRADLVCLARPHLSNPYWTLHAGTIIGDREEKWPNPYLAGRDQMWRLNDKENELNLGS